MIIRTFHLRLFYLFFVLFILFIGEKVYSQVDFTFKSSYSYLKGKDAATLSSGWMNPTFNYSSWIVGNAPFRYGDGEWGTELTDMQNNYSTLYLRSTFICSNHDSIKQLTFSADYDDGFIIWINGIQALSANAPSLPAYTSVAPEGHESGTGVSYIVYTDQMYLVEGVNHIAVQIFNISLSSTDLYFDLAIKGELSLPEYPDSDSYVSFSASSGISGNPFTLYINSPDPAIQIIYTLDGSDPRNSLTGDTTSASGSVLIDPSSSAGRPVTPGVIVRASLFKPGFKPSKPTTRTYLFTDKVRTQSSSPGGGWPTGNINGQYIDLAIDSRVINDPLYSGLIDDALIDIPSVSIVTDIGNLFDPVKGIYVNAEGHGLNWERECNTELIMPDGSTGFNVDAGIRIRGGWSRHDYFPKHAFRLFFREKYRFPKLNYPLFGDEGAEEFDKIDLRCEQNYAWSTGNPYNSLVREVFSRDTQRDMGKPYTRSRYYHLYLNGMYWGVYQTQERADANFASTYLGGKDEDYDVIKVNTENWSYTIEATDGNSASWNNLWNMCQAGFWSNASYFMLEGKDVNGIPVKNGEVMVDIDNLIDYMLLIFYSGNFDTPTSSFGNNKGSNNFYAIDNRNDKSAGFTFYAHDAEHSLFNEPHSPGIGLNEDRVNIGTRMDKYKMEVGSFSSFHPQWLHFKLTSNSEYRIRFADRAYMHFEKGGALTPENSLARINERISQVETAVIAESARWGDGNRTGLPYTRDVNWLAEIGKIRTGFIPYRSQIVISQLNQAGLYHVLDAPVIRKDGIIMSDQMFGFVDPFTIQVENPNNSGIIYYTLNGVDPRNPGGSIYPSSLFSINNLSIKINASTVISSRIFNNGTWGPLRKMSFISQSEDYSNLKITEINYNQDDQIHGTDTTFGKDVEFIEFKNIGSSSISMGGLILDSAISFSFPHNILLPPGKFFVIASDKEEFYDYYGMVPSGEFGGNLSNDTEEILLKDQSGRKIINFSYYDSYPWSDEADGKGYTLTSAHSNPTGDPADHSYWKSSFRKYGTPFADDNSSDPVNLSFSSKGSLLAYPSPTTGKILLRLVSKSIVNSMKVRVYNTSGHVSASFTTSNPCVTDLSALNLETGVYFIRCTSGSYDARMRIIFVK